MKDSIAKIVPPELMPPSKDEEKVVAEPEEEKEKEKEKDLDDAVKDAEESP